MAALAAAGHAAQLVLSHAISSRLHLATFGGAGLSLRRPASLHAFLIF